VHDCSLGAAIREFTNEVREDYREMARFHVVKTLCGTLINGGGGEPALAT
jgi:hypothetical protein